MQYIQGLQDVINSIHVTLYAAFILASRTSVETFSQTIETLLCSSFTVSDMLTFSNLHHENNLNCSDKSN